MYPSWVYGNYIFTSSWLCESFPSRCRCTNRCSTVNKFYDDIKDVRSKAAHVIGRCSRVQLWLVHCGAAFLEDQLFEAWSTHSRLEYYFWILQHAQRRGLHDCFVIVCSIPKRQSSIYPTSLWIITYIVVRAVISCRLDICFPINWHLLLRWSDMTYDKV